MSRLIDDLRKLNREELLERKGKALAELRKVKLELKAGNIISDNINKARKLKKEIAQISTVLREIELINELKIRNGGKSK